MKTYYYFYLYILAVIMISLFYNFMLFADDEKTEEDTDQKYLKKICLTEKDFPMRILTKRERPDLIAILDEFCKESKKEYKQSKAFDQDFLTEDKKFLVFLNYYIFESEDEVKKAVKYYISDIAIRMFPMNNPEKIGLTKNNTVYEDNETWDNGLIFQHKKIFLRISVIYKAEESEKQSSEKRSKSLCEQLAKTLVKRINKVDEEMQNIKNTVESNKKLNEK